MSYDDNCHKHIKEGREKWVMEDRWDCIIAPMAPEADVPATKAQCARQKDVQQGELCNSSHDNV